MNSNKFISCYYELENIEYIQGKMNHFLLNIKDNDNISNFSDFLIKLGSLYMKYPLYGDRMGMQLILFAYAIKNNKDSFIYIIDSSGIDFIHSVIKDLDVWLKRYIKEGITIETEHIFHLPTILAIDQIRKMVDNEEGEEESDEDFGDFEFF